MHPDCIKEVIAAIGRELKPGEADEIEGRILSNMRTLAKTEPTWNELTGNERLKAAAQLAKEQDVEAADKAALRKASNIAAQARESGNMLNRAAEMTGKAPTHKALFERLRQVENHINGVRHEAMANVMDAIEATEPRWLGNVSNPEAIADFAREVYAEKTGQKTGNEVAERGAKAYMEQMEAMRTRANSLGMDIGKLEAYLPRVYEVGNVARAGAEEFAADAMRGADRDAYVKADGGRMNDDELKSFLQQAWDSISTEGRNKLVPGAAVRGSRAGRFDDAHRQIHFKDADSELAFMAKYGRGSLFDQIQGHINAMAKNIALIESFGANPNSTFRLLKDIAQKQDNKAGARESGATLDMVWDALNGTTAQPVSARLAAAGQGVRNFVTATALQSVMLSSITDVPLHLLTAKYNGLPLGGTLKSSLKAFGGDTKRDATRLGLATESVAGEMQQWHTDNLAQGWANKLAQTTMKLTGVEAWTSALRRGFGIQMSSTLNELRKTNFKDLHERDLERAQAAGVTEQDWKVWQLAEPETKNGVEMLTKNGIRDIDGADLDKVLAPQVQSIKDEAQAHIDQLNQRNSQDQAWFSKRKEKLSAWLQTAQEDITERIASKDSKLDDRQSSALDGISEKIKRFNEQLDLAEGSWMKPEGDAPGIDTSQKVSFYGKRSLRKLGKQEGRAMEAIDNLESDSKSILSDIKKQKEQNRTALLDDLFSKFEARQKDLAEFAEKAKDRAKRRQFVIDKINDSIEPRLQVFRDNAVNVATAHLLGWIDQEAKTAVLSPDIMTRAAMQQGSKAGTLGGEIARSAMLFKSFPLAVWQKHARRLRSIDSTSGKIAYSAAMMTGLTLFGALAVQLTDMANGKNPRDMTTGKFWAAAFAKGGGLGVFGDIMYTGMGGNTTSGQPNWTNLLGPVFGKGAQLANLTLGNITPALEGKQTHAASEASSFVIQNTPFIRLWYLKTAVDHMFLHDLQEELSPGYLGRLRASTMRDWHQDYFWGPGDSINETKPPDMMAMAGGSK